MVQMAWNFVNDSLSTTLSLQWEPEIIAVALIYLACKLSKFNVTDWIGRVREHIKWWDMFVQDVTMDVLEDICHQVFSLKQYVFNNLVHIQHFRYWICTNSLLLRKCQKVHLSYHPARLHHQPREPSFLFLHHLQHHLCCPKCHLLLTMLVVFQ